MTRKLRREICGKLFLLLVMAGLLSCSKGGDSGSGSQSSTSPTNPSNPSTPSTPSCSTLTGSSWVPNVSGVSSANHDDSAVTVVSTTSTGSGDLIGATQAFSMSGAPVISFSFSVASDLGTAGSFTLTAKSTSMPNGVSGSAYPVLVSLVDPSGHEYVNLGSACTANGVYDANCGPTSPSAFPGASSADRRTQWSQHQFGVSAGVSVNMFPTCNWASGTPSCDFNAQNWFSSGKLRTGTYTAKYVLASDSFASVSAGASAGMSLTVTQKTDSDGGATRGSFDVNVILVGQKNVSDSRTTKGQQNLNALFQHVYDHYFTQNSSTMKVKIGSINVLEWDCATGGDSYATVSTTGMGNLFKTGSALVPSSTEGKAINVFIVSSLTGGGSGTLLGLSGGLVGAPVNGTPSSGLVFSSFDKLATYNPNCSGSGACTLSSQEAAFIDMGSTVSHELGHYLGLNHLSEATGATHDSIPDTPICTNITSGQTSTSIGSCLNDTNVHPISGQTCGSVCSTYNHTGTSTGTYCPTAAECQFNHVMWWTGKNYDPSGNGDGNLFSSQSSTMVGYNPYVR